MQRRRIGKRATQVSTHGTTSLVHSIHCWIQQANVFHVAYKQYQLIERHIQYNVRD